LTVSCKRAIERAAVRGSVDGSPDDTRISLFGVPNLASFVEFFAGKVDVGGGGNVPLR
jgi:hypothetical protein